MSEKKFELSVNSNIMEVISRYPKAVEIFAKNGLPCVGCAAARFESISDIVGEFGIDGEELIQEIKESEKEDSK